MATGVNEFISLPRIRSEIDRKCADGIKQAIGEPIVELQSPRPSLIGSSFDLLCGLWFRRNVPTFIPGPNAHPVFSENKMAIPYRQDELVAEYQHSLKICLDYMNGRNPTNELFEAVLFLIQYDNFRMAQSRYFHYQRNHYEPEYTANLNEEPNPDEVGEFTEESVEELSQLFDVLDDELLQTSKVYFKPSFGDRSDLLKAEGDIILDDVLIDIKVTSDCTHQRKYWRQLLAYYLLNDINNCLDEIDYRTYNRRTYPDLSAVGIYFARQNQLNTISINDIFSSEEEYCKFRAWFTNEIIEQDKDGRFSYGEVREELCEPWDYEEQTLIDDFC